MRILVLGFGPLARNITDRIKRFPEYGLSNEVFIYHIFTRRNSLSYGKDLVVEIPDPHGDGYRTYNDGLQGLDEYATTISNYKPWLLEEAKSGAFDVVIDCTNRTQSSYSLIGELLRVSPDGLKIVPASIVGEDAAISRIRCLLDGGAPWSSIEFEETLLSLANIVNNSAEIQMKKYHQINRKADIDSMGNPTAAAAMDHYSLFSAIPDFDQDLINRFIVNGEKSDEYVRSEIYDPIHDCLVIEHEMLTSFFGWHHTEQLAAKEFLDSELEIESARYIKYLSSDSTPISDPDSEYAIEYVHSGKLFISSADGMVTIPLVGGTEYSSFSYRPKLNPPRNREIHAGLEIIVFTYRKMANAD